MRRNTVGLLICAAAFMLIGTEKASAQVVYNNTVVTPIPYYGSYYYPYTSTYYGGIAPYGVYGYGRGYRRGYVNGAYYGRGYTGAGAGYRTGYRAGYAGYRGGYRGRR